MAKLLENGPCKESAARLKAELTEQDLLPPRYDWRGQAHPKTFRDMEEEFDPSGKFLEYYCSLLDMGRFLNLHKIDEVIIYNYLLFF